MRLPVYATALLAVCFVVESSAWKNPRKSASATSPVFGTHDYIAFKGYALADRPSFLRLNLAAFFLGTEAPDNGSLLPGAVDDYPDAQACHCILFDEDGNVTRDRGERQVRREFDKARAAFKAGDRPCRTVSRRNPRTAAAVTSPKIRRAQPNDEAASHPVICHTLPTPLSLPT